MPQAQRDINKEEDGGRRGIHTWVFLVIAQGKDVRAWKGEQSQGASSAKVKFGHLNQKQQSPEVPFCFLLTLEKSEDIFIFDIKGNRHRTQVLLGYAQYFLLFSLLKPIEGKAKPQ